MNNLTSSKFKLNLFFLHNLFFFAYTLSQNLFSLGQNNVYDVDEELKICISEMVVVMILIIENVIDKLINQFINKFRDNLKTKKKVVKKKVKLDGQKVTDIGYFYLDLFKKFGLGDYIIIGKDIYWRNVNLFIDVINDTISNNACINKVIKHLHKLFWSKA